MSKCAAIYCRISSDRSGRAEGVEVQERWGREYASVAWPHLPVRVFADNSISASNGDHRPGFEALRAAIARGEVAEIWVAEQTRLERREKAWFELADMLVAAGIACVHSRRDGIIRVGDDLAGIKAVLAAGEIRRMKHRLQDKARERAAQGLPHGGSLCFGYRRATKVNDDGTVVKTLVPDETEAAAVREAARLVLAGWSSSRIADWLNSETYPDGSPLTTATGRPFDRSGIRKFLTSPMVAGKRSHRGQVTEGNWPAILDHDTWQAVAARITGPRTVAGKSGPKRTGKRIGRAPGRRYLLTSGLARCGVCRAALSGSEKQLRYARMPYLTCNSSKSGKGCVGIMLEPVEHHVVEQLWDRLDDDAFVAAVVGDPHADRRDEIRCMLAGIEAQRAELAEAWAAGKRTMVEWDTAREALDTREHALRSELAELAPVSVDADQLRSVRGAWGMLSLDEKRHFLSLCIDRVLILRAKPGARKFDPERVVIEWRTIR